MGISSTTPKTRCFALVAVAVTVQLILGIGCTEHVFAAVEAEEFALAQTIVASTPIEKALDELRARFPNRIVIGFEELFDPPSDKEPQVDLGPKDLSLQQVLNRVRRIDPRYKVELLPGRLLHVNPIQRTADPVGLLDIRLREFSMPQDSCLQSAIENIDRYAPELSQFLVQRAQMWYRTHHKQVLGVVGDILGNCFPEAAPGPAYKDLTVRDSLNLLVKRSLALSRKEVTPDSTLQPPYRPLSWKFRFRRDAEADTGLGGRPLFQTF
jgi:hypothetical protein